MTKNSGLHDFAFDKVFAERCQQSCVYEEAARRLVMEFLNGTSASIICSLDNSLAFLGSESEEEEEEGEAE